MSNYMILAIVFIVLAFVSDVLFLTTAGSGNNITPLFFPIATVLFIIGSALYAKARGFGALIGIFGVLNLLGFIIVAAIISHFKYHEKKNQSNN
ncbi:MAG: hypothetical protein U5L10_01070 [Candidatus Moranbacteria bacterium]|nr:hypothetical protein [Candidatus Moranbacteria bacterium]